MTLPYPLSLWVEKGIPLQRFKVDHIYQGAIHWGRHIPDSDLYTEGTLADVTSWCKSCTGDHDLNYFGLTDFSIENLALLALFTNVEATIEKLPTRFSARKLNNHIGRLMDLRSRVDVWVTVPALKRWQSELISRLDQEFERLTSWVRGPGRRTTLAFLGEGTNTSWGLTGLIYQLQAHDHQFLVSGLQQHRPGEHQALRLMRMIEPGPVISGRMLALYDQYKVVDSYALVTPDDTDDIIDLALRLMSEGGEFANAQTALRAAHAL